MRDCQPGPRFLKCATMSGSSRSVLAKLVPLDDAKPKRFKFGTLKGVLTDGIAGAIEAPLPDGVLAAMLNPSAAGGDR